MSVTAVDDATDPSGAPRLPEALAAARAALEALAAVDLDGVPGAELSGAVLECQRLRGALEAGEARVLARWDASRQWRADGAKTAAAWLAWKERIPVSVARARLRHARAARDLPAVAEAWAAGDIDRAHITTILTKRTPRTAGAFARDHERLIRWATTKRFVEFKRRCDRWEATVDPDGAEQGAEADRSAREVHLSQTLGGMWYGRMTLDPISGTIVSETLAAIEQELFDADRAAAKARLGRDPSLSDLGRTPAQRRADALVEMAARARTAPADGRRPRPLFSVLVGYETFAGPMLELFSRTMLTPGQAARWLRDADIERIVFDGASRVIDVGRQKRLFTGALRRAIEVRDRVCYHPSCDEPPDRRQIDHIHEAAKGGPTTQDNGRLACAFHNQLRNKERPDQGRRGSDAPDPPGPRPHRPDPGTDGPDPPDDPDPP